MTVGVGHPVEALFGGDFDVAGDLEDFFVPLALELALGKANAGFGDTGERLGPAQQGLFRNRFTHDFDATNNGYAVVASSTSSTVPTSPV